MIFLIVFLSCKEEPTYPTSAPSNCSAWFCAEDFVEGTVDPSTGDTEDTSIFDTANPDDTGQALDTFGNPIDGDGEGDGSGDGDGNGDSAGDDSGFNKESDECGCADPGSGLSLLLFTSLLGLWRRER